MRGAFSGRFGCGDTVREIDGRHAARVEAIVNELVKVRWHGTRWLSWLPEEDLELVERAPLAVPHCGTVVPSAAFRLRYGLK